MTDRRPNNGIMEPIRTAPRDQGREILVAMKPGGPLYRVYWWRHWSMPEGCWWSPQHGVVRPIRWLAQ